MTPKSKTYIQHSNHYYYVLRQYGICRENGLTAHGLRHGHMNDYYEEVTGHKTPVRGGSLREADKELDSHARKLVSERAGHARESISTAYIGSKRRKKKKKA